MTTSAFSAYTPNLCAAALRNYNAWRRGSETIELPNPAEIGVAIDAAVLMIEQFQNLLTAAQSTLNENLHLADGDNCTLFALKRAVEDITGGEI